MKLPNLEAYNRLIWAVIGTGLLVLATLGGGLVAAKLLGEVSVSHGETVARDVTGNVDPGAAQYDFCRPVIPYGSRFQLIRVASDRLVVGGSAISRPGRDVVSALRAFKYGKSSETCAFEGRDVPSAIVNVLVRDAETGELHRALDENALVLELDYASSARADDFVAFPPAGILYWEIARTDTSGDGMIDQRDDAGVYLSDLDARNMKRITPTPSRLLDRTYDRQRNVLLLRVLRDTNGDRKLDVEDHASLVEVSVSTRTVTREILDSDSLAAAMRASPDLPAADQR